MDELGFKHLTADNWLEIDPVTKLFVRGTSGASIKGEEWLESILQPKLIDPVPYEIKRLFEVARGAMVYGYFFYPLYTLGFEQLSRVSEAAIAHKWEQCNGPKKKTFQQRIEWLTQNGYLSEENSKHWDSFRHLRNISSHPVSQNILMPSDAIRLTRVLSEQINILFNEDT